MQTDLPPSHASAALRNGRRAFLHAQYLLSFDEDSSRAEAEETARRSFEAFRSAMNWYEADFDDDGFETAHRELDAAGAFVRAEFGCTLLFENGTYFQSCPVSLAHNRSGLSPGFIIRKSECSVCHRDPEDCDHITGPRVSRGLVLSHHHRG